MKIQSKPAIVGANTDTVREFLTDARNLEHLLPQDKISDFKADESQCSFKIQGAIVITLVQDGVENGNVKLKSGEKSPFPFNLIVNLNGDGEFTKGNIDFNGEVNMFIKMMAEKPLTALFEHMTQALQKHFA